MVIKLTEFNIKFNKQTVMHMIDCMPDNPLYEEMIEEMESLEEEAYSLIDAKALLAFGEITPEIATDKIPKGTKALFAITSVGGSMSKWSTALFGQGDYVAGMLVDAMADDALFQIDTAIKDTVINMSKDAKMGITKRLEAPTGISMEAQKVAWEITNAKEEIGLDIKSSYMYDPVKTTCQIYLLDEACKEFRTEHNCRECNATKCKLRNVPPVTIIVKNKDSQQTILCKEQQSILGALIENHIFISAVCAGRGTCGKCKIKVLNGDIAISKEDEKFFSQAELENGYRLSCTAYPSMDCTILLDISEEKEFYVVTDYSIQRDNKYENLNKPDSDKIDLGLDNSKRKLGIGIDIGTTTIAMQLIDRENGEILDTFSIINKQRSYGADVISRIESSNSGKREELRQCIVKELKEGISKWIIPLNSSYAEPNTNDSISQIEQIVIAGNTTMIHLLMGYSCATLGVYPFTPVNIETIHTTYANLLGDTTWNIPIVIFPGISTFVGGDIVAGLLECNYANEDKLAILIDLGTNGEMAIGNSKKIIVTSTAAGPAFEGGNITFGTGSIPGAICNVNIIDGEVNVQTIADKSPVGICGTGVIEATCELRKEGLLDETGLLEEDYFEDGYPLVDGNSSNKIVFTQKDIREIQLAKSAIRAGVETLLRRYEVLYENIDTVYLAGGFGYKVDITKAMEIGLLPKEFNGKVQTIGNSSLRGTISYLCHEDAAKQIAQILDVSHEINLSNDRDFNEFYMEYMYF